jgi:hypothetical protein
MFTDLGGAMGAWKGISTAALALFACNCLEARVIGTPQSEFRHVYSLEPNGRVSLHNLYGDVRITAWDRDEVLVQAIKKSRDPKQLDDTQIVVDASSDQLSIHTQYAGSNAEHPTSVDYQIVVPRSASLENVKLINGGLTISGVAGQVKASSVNGSIHAENLEGETELSTVNGRLEAGFHRLNRDKPITLRSVNGPIRLLIPPGMGAVLTARNLSGGIESEFGRVFRGDGGHRLHTMVRRGGTHIHVHNVNGGISIRAALRATDRPWS